MDTLPSELYVILSHYTALHHNLPKIGFVSLIGKITNNSHIRIIKITLI